MTTPAQDNFNTVYDAFGNAVNFSGPYVNASATQLNSALPDKTNAYTAPAALSTGQVVGALLAGQTDYDTGIGFWLGMQNGVPKFSIGNSAGNELKFNGTTLSVSGAISAASLDIPDTTTANSFHVNTVGDAWWGATTFGAAVASISKAGVGLFTSITATGTINATGGFIGSATALVYESTGVNTGITGHVRGGATDYLTGTGFFLGYSGAAYKFSVGNPAGNYIGWDGTTLTIIGNQVDVQTFDANGTWTKPTGAKSTKIQCWGGGGGGGNASASSGVSGAGGGGGGSYLELTIASSNLGATETVTVGASAAGGASSGANGTAGNNSSFGSWITAYGGGFGFGSTNNQGGGGGGGAGIHAVGSNAVSGTVGGVGGAPSGGAVGTAAVAFGGGGGGSAGQSGGLAMFGGGGGGAGDASNNGGNSDYGGGGGGAGGSGGTGGTGGVSQFGGSGGAGSSGTGVGSPGVAPGGGGGGGAQNAGNSNKNGGAGAAGRIVVTTYL